MTLNNLSHIKPDDPRLERHVTTYQASRGGSFPPVPKPVPGTPKEKN